MCDCDWQHIEDAMAENDVNEGIATEVDLQHKQLPRLEFSLPEASLADLWEDAGPLETTWSQVAGNTERASSSTVPMEVSVQE